MAERIISPGVFTREIDQSFLPGAVAQIGAAIVGPTVKGPALVPTRITSWGDFVSKFGSYTTDSYVPFAVKDYLDKGGNTITVTRLLYEDGYYLTNGALAICAESASVKHATHILHPTRPVTSDGATNIFQNSILSDGGSGVFALTLSGSYAAAADSAIGFSGAFTKTISISASIVPAANNYVTTLFGKSPLSNDYPAYVQYENRNASALFADITKVTMSLQTISNYEFLQDYNVASTPWITSQLIGSTTTYNLFKFHTLSHGTSVNYETKIGIRDIRTAGETADPDGYGSFTVVIRRVNTASPVIVGSPYSSQDRKSTRLNSSH